MDLADPEVIRALSQVHTWPLTFEICRGIHDLDFSSDPADEIIASTSIAPIPARMPSNDRVKLGLSELVRRSF
jgi:hypothetical protein